VVAARLPKAEKSKLQQARRRVQIVLEELPNLDGIRLCPAASVKDWRARLDEALIDRAAVVDEICDNG
jgi:hypothetical protein